MNVIELFAGIGGFRLGFDRAGCTTIFASEIDRFARQTYHHNFEDMPYGDVTQLRAGGIPDHDILTAGFPCQPFSMAQKQAVGMAHTKGTMFYEIIRIATAKRPKMILLENVKGLTYKTHRATFKAIVRLLTDLGYTVYWQVLNAWNYVPQNRERVFFACFRAPVAFQFPQPPNIKPSIASILETDVDDSYYLGEATWKSLLAHKQRHINNGNGFGYQIADMNSNANTLSHRYGKDGSEILIMQYRADKNRYRTDHVPTLKANMGTGGNMVPFVVSQVPRKLTERECARLMGFPDTYEFPCSRTQTYKQLGNAVVVPLVADIAQAMLEAWEAHKIIKVYEQLSLFEAI